MDLQCIEKPNFYDLGRYYKNGATMSLDSSKCHEEANEIEEQLNDDERSQDVENGRWQKQEQNFTYNMTIHRIRLKAFLSQKSVQITLLVLIVINSITMGIATFDVIQNNRAAYVVFEYIDLTCLIIFTIELVINLIACGLNFRKDGWLMFDMIVIPASWILRAMNIQVIRALRIFKILSYVPLLRYHTQIIVKVIPRLRGLIVLLFIINLVFSIMFTSLFGDAYKNNDVEVDYFSTLVNTILTLEQLMTMDNWMNVTESVMKFYSWGWILIILYVFLSSFIIVALTIAVICEGYMNEHKTIKRKREKESMTKSDEDKCVDKFISIETRMNDIHQQLKMIIDSGYGNGNSMLEFHDDDNDDCISYSTPLKSTSLPDIKQDCLESSSHECKNQTIEGNETMIESPMSEIQSPTVANKVSFHSKDKNSNETGPYTFKERYGKVRSVCGMIVQNIYFELFIVGLVVINTIILIVDLYEVNKGLDRAISIVDKVLLSIFTLETVLKLIYHHLAFFRQPWLVFDFLVILASWIFASFQFFRALRVLRVLLLIPRFKQVHVLFLAFAKILPRLGGVMALFIIFLYVSGIIFTVLFQHYEVDANYFSRLDNTLLTLFRFSTMDDWSSIAREYEKVTSAWTPQLIFFYVAISGYILLNLMVGVIAVAIEQVNKIICPREPDGDYIEDDHDKKLERVQEIQIDVLNMIKTMRRESGTSEVSSNTSIGNRVLQTISKKEDIEVVISKLS